MGTHEFCPACGFEGAAEHIVRKELLSIRGEEIEIQAEGRRCGGCGEVFSNAEEMERNLEAAYAVYRARRSLMSPAEIRKLREIYGASQKAFGIILGFGELTINSYEQGALPAEANANLLKLVDDPAAFSRLFESRKGLIGPTQRKRIEAALEKLKGSAIACLREAAPAYQSNLSREGSIYTGFQPSNKEKLFALIRTILIKAGRPLYKTQILKLLFYCDFEHFRKATVSITGWQYAAIDYGPVPNDFQLFLPEAVEKGSIACSPDESQERDLYSIPADAGDDAHSYDFSAEELSTVDAVVARLGRKSAKALVDLTHQEKAWKETEHAAMISYEWAQELSGM
jgi:putative zinc finger/helix-turn-helix YgiT family protein